MSTTARTATRRPRHDADAGVPALVQLLIAVAVLAGGAAGGQQWLEGTCPAATDASLMEVCTAVGL